MKCKRCGSHLNTRGYCWDETCPFSDHQPKCKAGWNGHPQHDPNPKDDYKPIPCTCEFLCVEYDRSYCGGDYKGVGEFVLIPLTAIRKKDGVDAVDNAFQKATGLNAMRIIHYSQDEVYDKDGKLKLT